MKVWISTIKYYLRQFIELGLLLLGVSVFAELLFGPDVPALFSIHPFYVWSRWAAARSVAGTMK